MLNIKSLKLSTKSSKYLEVPHLKYLNVPKPPNLIQLLVTNLLPSMLPFKTREGNNLIAL